MKHSKAFSVALSLLFLPFLWQQAKGQCAINVQIQQGEDFYICPGTSAVLTATPGLNNYLWEDGSTASTRVVAAAGQYWVASTNGGCTSMDTINVYFYPAVPAVQLNHPGPLVTACQGDTLQLGVVNEVYDAYLWNFASHTESAVPITTPGYYWVYVLDSNGCGDSSDAVQVAFLPAPNPNLGADTTICNNAPYRLDAGVFNAYLWQDGSTGRYLDVSSPGFYNVTVTGSNGCTKADGIFITTKASPTADLGPDLVVCPNVPFTLDAGAGFAAYRWQDNSHAQTFTDDTIGTYWVVVTAANGCPSNPDSVNVSFDPTAVPTISWDGTTLSTENYTAYQWYFNDSIIPGATSQTYVPDLSGYYSVRVTSSLGCQIDAAGNRLIRLGVAPVKGFSPNGDGIGDFFVITGIELYPGNELKIFSRWGQMVYDRVNYLNNWNGESSEGQKLPDGTYFFTLDLNDGMEPISDYLIINR